jgi:hypothetical protein
VKRDDIERIQSTELSPDQRAILVEDGKRWKRLAGGGHLDDWLAFGPGMRIRRNLAMRIAFTNNPEGRAYNGAMTALMERDGLHTMDKTSMTAVLWLYDNPEHMNLLNEIRDTMTAGQRSRLNSPISARQRGSPGGGNEEQLRESPVANLKAKLVEKEREIAHLEERLAAADKRDALLSDFKRASAADIAAVLVKSVTASKANAIIKQLQLLLKKPQPAG